MSKSRPQESLAEHEAILEAIKERDIHKVEYLIHDHRGRNYQQLLSDYGTLQRLISK